MNKFREWYLSNATEITWFIIGWCTLAGFDSLIRGDMSSATINFALAIAVSLTAFASAIASLSKSDCVIIYFVFVFVREI